MIHDRWSSLVCVDDPPSPVGGPSERRLVLLVSEDPLMVRALSRLLRRAGYEVAQREASPAVSAKEDPRQPALAIVDVPDDWSRRDVSSAYKPPVSFDAPRVLWIGEANETMRRREGYLTKPFTGNDLLSKVAALLAD